jgi:hypothetical protein
VSGRRGTANLAAAAGMAARDAAVRDDPAAGPVVQAAAVTDDPVAASIAALRMRRRIGPAATQLTLMRLAVMQPALIRPIRDRSRSGAGGGAAAAARAVETAATPGALLSGAASKGAT